MKPKCQKSRSKDESRVGVKEEQQDPPIRESEVLEATQQTDAESKTRPQTRFEQKKLLKINAVACINFVGFTAHTCTYTEVGGPSLAPPQGTELSVNSSDDEYIL